MSEYKVTTELYHILTVNTMFHHVYQRVLVVIIKLASYYTVKITSSDCTFDASKVFMFIIYYYNVDGSSIKKC